MDANQADALVLFGATGDLAFRKIYPALKEMMRHGHLKVPVIGVARAGWDLERFRAWALSSIEAHGGGVDEAAKMPYLLESRLRELGGVFRAGKPWMSHVVVDRNLVTGQNPASSAGVAREALARLGAPVPR
jgi:hypothetical protein